MTYQQRTILNHVIGGLVTILASAAVIILSGAWSSKESVSAHRADILTIRAWQQRVLDVVCLDHPQARQCTATGDGP